MNEAILKLTNGLDEKIKNHAIVVSKYVNDFGFIVIEVSIMSVWALLKSWFIRKQIIDFMESTRLQYIVKLHF